jgi:hypothetical protein
MRVELSDISSMVIAHDIFKYLRENFILETCGTPDGMVVEGIGDIIKEKVNDCLNEFNNKGMII